MTWIDDAEQKIAEALAKSASNGSVPAASVALKVLAERRNAQAIEAHKETMAAMESDTLVMCRYLGQLDQSSLQVMSRIGHRMDNDEKLAWEKGREDRAIEIRALEIARARDGRGTIKDWMRSSAKNDLMDF